MKKQIKHNKIVLVWTVLWLISFAILVLGPNELWVDTTITIIAALTNFILIIAMLYSSKNQFDDYDEFQKTIQLKAVSLTLFLTIFIGLFLIGLHKSGLLILEPQIHHLVVFSALTFIFSTIFIFKTYQ
tara:strand:+ start:381 stop:767 length:387 start_codon:yes stop_codon:yes gene_type:complete